MTGLTELSKKMHNLADSGHERAEELREKADFLDTVANEKENLSPKKLLGAWARARRLWCDCTGEDLV
jgi:hypothetical protein